MVLICPFCSSFFSGVYLTHTKYAILMQKII